MAVEKYVIALTVVGIVDAISYMLVTPSLVFYVLQNGGTKDQYGLIMSAFSFSSFCMKPIVGWWSDHQGFRAPYVVSLLIALVGGIVYVLASALPAGNVAVLAIFGARLLGGCGAANSALGYAYVARSVPAKKQTAVNSLLSLCRILGMAVGPGVNILVARVDVPIGTHWRLDSLNSVGLIIVACNLTAMAAILYFLEEPGGGGEEEGDSVRHDDEKAERTKSSSSAVLCSLLSVDVLVPMLSIFAFNANFQLIETGFAPAANDGLGWGPVQSSVALGSISFVIAANMVAVMRLSERGVSEANMLCGGLVLSTVAYVLVYALWIKDSTAWNFYLPVLLGASSFPYLAATTRTIFTLAVNAKPALKDYHGSMQAVLSMAASVAGFVTPGIVAAYCLRHPGDVAASIDGRELAPAALFAPVLSIITLLGVLYLRVTGVLRRNEALAGATAAEDATNPESLPRVRESSPLVPKKNYSTRWSKARRRSSNIEIVMEMESSFDGLEQSFRARAGTLSEAIG